MAVQKLNRFPVEIWPLEVKWHNGEEGPQEVNITFSALKVCDV